MDILKAIDDIFSSARLTDIGVLVGYLVLAAHGLGLGVLSYRPHHRL